jgi:hypothetical protein
VTGDSATPGWLGVGDDSVVDKTLVRACFIHAAEPIVQVGFGQVTISRLGQPNLSRRFGGMRHRSVALVNRA